MALITRVSRLFRADVNAVLDRMEEPELLLKQAVREMEEELAREEQRARLMELELKQVATRYSDLENRVGEIGEELDLCFDTGNEELARVLLKRKLESERFIKFLARKREELERTVEALSARIEENRTRLDSMRQKAELLAGQECDDEASAFWAEPEFNRQFTVTEDDIELALLREQQKRAKS